MSLITKEVLNDLKNREKVSISSLQRVHSIGFNKARILFDQLVLIALITPCGGVNKSKVQEKLGETPTEETKIIFLDVDGVLNCNSTKDLCGYYIGIEDHKVDLLKKIVDATGAKIVLVSSWKECWYKGALLKERQDDSADYLDAKLAKASLTIFDKTEDRGFNRGDGIKEYIRRLEWEGVKVGSFVILDDEMFDYKEMKLTKNLIQTSYTGGGLKEKHVEHAIAILGGKS